MTDLYTYFLAAELSDCIKIGKTATPPARACDLEVKWGECKFIAIVSADEISEAAAHKVFDSRREHGEWFRITEDEVFSYMDQQGVESVSLNQVNQTRKARTRHIGIRLTKDLRVKVDRRRKTLCIKSQSEYIRSLILADVEK